MTIETILVMMPTLPCGCDDGPSCGVINLWAQMKEWYYQAGYYFKKALDFRQNVPIK